MHRTVARGAQTAAALIALTIMLAGMVLWRRLGKAAFVETRTPMETLTNVASRFIDENCGKAFYDDHCYIKWGEPDRPDLEDGWFRIIEFTKA